MPTPCTRTRWRVVAALALLCSTAAAPPVGPDDARTAVQAGLDVPTLIFDAAPGEMAALEAALPHVTDPASLALLRARIAAARLRDGEANAALDAFFAVPGTTPAQMAAAWSTKADVAFAAGDYATATKALTKAEPLLKSAGRTKEAVEAGRTLSLARLLANEPRQMVVGGTPGDVPTARDKAGLLRANVTVNGVAQDAVLDTGANLSVVTATNAARLKLRMLEGSGIVGAGGISQVPTRTAIADKITIAGVELRNVAFLVMDDAALSFPLPGGYTIDAIIGFPVFRALERVQFDRSGGFRAGGPATKGAENLRAAGNDLIVLTKVNDMDAPLQLDSGASSTALSSGFAKRHPDLVAQLPVATRHIAGAGGARQQPIALLRPANVTIEDRRLVLDQMQIVTGGESDNGAARMGVLGHDILGRFEWFALDFRSMRFELGAPAEAVSHHHH